MKNVVLKKIEPSERLVKLVDKIEFLEIDHTHCVLIQEGCLMYSIGYNDINHLINREERQDEEFINKLLNKEKLFDCISRGTYNISQEQFCDLLEEHLIMEARAKMEELLPQIQEWIPTATIHKADEINALCISKYSNKISYIVYLDHNFKMKANPVEGCDNLWLDRDNLKVRRSEPWWETQEYFYYIESYYKSLSVERGNFNEIGLCENRAEFVSKCKYISETKEEAQAMYDKLNAKLEEPTIDVHGEMPDLKNGYRVEVKGNGLKYYSINGGLYLKDTANKSYVEVELHYKEVVNIYDNEENLIWERV